MKDIILKNVNIYSSPRRGKGFLPWWENIFSSIALSSGKIAKIDSFETLKDKYPRAEVVDLKGKTVLSGFIDSHIHLLQTGYTKIHLNLSGVSSLADLKESIKNAAREKKEGEWIIATSFDENSFREKKLPTKKDLDEVAPFNPVFIIRVCTHLFVVNSKALEIAGIDKSTPSPSGGLISRDENGYPNGILKERAADRINDFINSNYKLQKEALRAAIREVKTHGITTVHDMAIGIKNIENYKKLIEVYREVLEEEEYPLRIFLGVEHELLEKILNMEIDFLQGDDYFRQGYVKIFADGSFGGRTALLNDTYLDTGGFGLETMQKEEIEKAVERASREGYQCAVHAIGDRALERTVDILSKYNAPGLRHRVVHAGMTKESITSKIADNNLGVDYQPNFLASEVHWITKIFSSEQLKNLYSWKSFTNQGVLLAASSDSPVEPSFPFLGIRAAALRKNLNDWPEEGFNPEESLTLEEALYSYTYSGAYQYFEESYKGLIEEGYFADLVVLSHNPFEIELNKLNKIKPLYTFVGGRLIHREDGEKSKKNEQNV